MGFGFGELLRHPVLVLFISLLPIRKLNLVRLYLRAFSWVAGGLDGLFNLRPSNRRLNGLFHSFASVLRAYVRSNFSQVLF